MADGIETVPLIDGPAVTELRRAADYAHSAAEYAAAENALTALDALRDLGHARRDLDAAELALVRYARGKGRTWADVGSALGVTRQAASIRYRGALR